MKTGALVIGTNYRALGVARSLGRRQIPVWILKQGDQNLANLSRYAERCYPWPQGTDKQIVEQLLTFGREHQLQSWVLWPTDDECAHLIAQNSGQLGEMFRLAIASWQTIESICDKRLLYQLATKLKIAQPKTFFPRTRKELAEGDYRYPAILKPAIREKSRPVPLTKAWLAHDLDGLVQHYDLLSREMDTGVLMVQELIPGSGRNQFSYSGIYDGGKPLAGVSARRTRQYPRDFGRFSTFVESVDEPRVVPPALKILSAVGFTGIAEVEFKYDERDQEFKLLDINPRVWGWHTLGQRMGIDFSYLLWRLVNGLATPELTPVRHARWMRMSSDLPVAIIEITQGRLSWPDYLRSLRGTIEPAIFAKDDPLPGMCELPLLAYMISKRILGRALRKATSPLAVLRQGKDLPAEHKTASTATQN